MFLCASAFVTVCFSLSIAARAAPNCKVREGVVAEVAPGPFLPSTETVTMKSTYNAEFRWNINDREAIGWMRITEADGREIGWVPVGHEAVQCGEGN
ncbi:MAG: hypothetical protein CTY31_06595 [Hyphomicrobium sp.]|nr:MAG: hypothetical protein CTY39_07120 [Hyphomicrobium sp.]PPD00739.1 MAG: hypothetical protein CTY31_06595 [Hyphomicrobium sp.]